MELNIVEERAVIFCSLIEMQNPVEDTIVTKSSLLAAELFGPSMGLLMAIEAQEYSE